jgi:hypothetical protein
MHHIDLEAAVSQRLESLGLDARRARINRRQVIALTAPVEVSNPRQRGEG